MAKPFTSAHFAIALWRDVFPENFFIPKSAPAMWDLGENEGLLRMGEW